MNSIIEKLRNWFQKHPSIRDACLWAIPALLFGAALRLILLHYSPYAYWGSDSYSYYDFARKLIDYGDISLSAKRRFIYPFFMVPVTLLPGSVLAWTAWIQHILGLLTLFPLAYAVRKSFVHWKWTIIPVTAFYAGLPVIFWYEHELLGETIMFDAIAWMCGGWIAWVTTKHTARGAQLWWWFFVPFAIACLTKPSSRFLWLGVIVALVLVQAWRYMNKKHVISLGLLLIAMLGVGDKRQGAWLAYVAMFPLTQVDTPLHAEYKTEIRGKVEEYYNKRHTYYGEDDWAFGFLENPDKQNEWPLWRELGKDKNEKLRAKIYKDIVVEGALARPDLVLYLGLQRLVASANPSQFKEGRFDPDYSARRFDTHYKKMTQSEDTDLIRYLFGLSSDEPLPSAEELDRRMSPPANSWTEKFLQNYVATFNKWSDFFPQPEHLPKDERHLRNFGIAPLGWLFLFALPLSILIPRYRNTVGVLMLIGMGYLCGFFLIGQMNPRYFAPAWPVLAILLALPIDFALSLLTRLFKGRTVA